MRIDPRALNELLHRQVDPEAARDVLARGVAASPGAASGRIVFTAEAAQAAAAQGEAVVLVRRETSPEDIRGMHAAVARADGAGRHDQPCGGDRAGHRPALRGGGFAESGSTRCASN